MSFPFSPTCCCRGCYQYLWNLLYKYIEVPNNFLKDTGKLGATGWSAPSIYPQYQGSGDAARICTVKSMPFAAEVVFNSLPDGSVVRWYINVAVGLASSSTYVQLNVGTTGSAALTLVSPGVTTTTEVSTSIVGYQNCNFSVVVQKQPTCNQWWMGLIWNPVPTGPNTCPGLLGFDSNPTGGALIPTLLTSDGVGSVNDLNLNTGGNKETGPFPTCAVDCCSSILAIPLSGKPTHNGVGLYLSGTLPILIAGVGVATPLPDGFWNSSADSFDSACDCCGFPQDCGCSDCTMYITLSGFNYTGTDSCNHSSLNGMHALTSVKGIMSGMNAQACASGPPGNNTGVWSGQLGTVYISPDNPGNDCCLWIVFSITYDPASGYTSFDFAFAVGGPTTSGTPPYGCSMPPPATSVASYSDNVGFGGITGGRKTCGGMSGIDLSWNGNTVSGYDLTGCSVTINGSSGEDCDAQDCTGVTPPPPPDCTTFVMPFCAFKYAGDTVTYQVYINGTLIATTVIDPTMSTVGGDYITTNATYDWSGGAGPGASEYGAPCYTTPQVIISSGLFVSGANTLRITATGIADVVSIYNILIATVDSSGSVCNVLLNVGETVTPPYDQSYTFYV